MSAYERTLKWHLVLYRVVSYSIDKDKVTAQEEEIGDLPLVILYLSGDRLT